MDDENSEVSRLVAGFRLRGSSFVICFFSSRIIDSVNLLSSSKHHVPNNNIGLGEKIIKDSIP